MRGLSISIRAPTTAAQKGEGILLTHYLLDDRQRPQLVTFGLKSILFTDHARLYDLREDPLETRDLADDPDHAATLARHRAHFRQYIAQIEMYPEPDNVEEMALARGNLYREYIDWYTSVLNEA